MIISLKKRSRIYKLIYSPKYFYKHYALLKKYVEKRHAVKLALCMVKELLLG